MTDIQKQNVADMLTELLEAGNAWMLIGDDNRPVVYVNDGDVRYCLKKAQVWNEESKTLVNKWVNLGPTKAKANPKVTEALRELKESGFLSV